MPSLYWVCVVYQGMAAVVLRISTNVTVSDVDRIIEMRILDSPTACTGVYTLVTY